MFQNKLIVNIQFIILKNILYENDIYFIFFNNNVKWKFLFVYKDDNDNNTILIIIIFSYFGDFIRTNIILRYI